MDIQTIDLTADRNTIAGGPHRVFQAHALNLTLTLPTGENLDGADTLFAEIHYSRTITPASILASAELPLTTGDAEGPFDLSFTAAQMNQTVDESTRDFWLVIYADIPAESRVDVLYIGTLTMVRHNASGLIPTAPEPPVPARYAFKTIAVSGQSSVVADTAADTLTIAAGTGITITTNATTNTITITGTAAATWGSITGTLASQTDLQNALNAKVSTSTVAVTSGKTLTVSNTITISGTDGSTLNVGTGGTLGTAAFTDSSAYADAIHTHLSADVTDAAYGAESDTGKLLKIRAGGYVGGVYLVADGLPGEAGGQIRIQNAAQTFQTVFRAEGATAERTLDCPDEDGTLATRTWVTSQNYTTGGLLIANNLSDLSNVVTARSNLGLGTIATQAASNVAITGGSATFTGPVLIPAGTAGAPGLAFSADADGTGTGIYRSAANELSVATNGTQRVKVAAGGDVTITSTTAATSASSASLVTGGGLGVGLGIFATGEIRSGALVVASSGFAALSGNTVKLCGDNAGNPCTRLAFQFTPNTSGMALNPSGTTLSVTLGDGTAGGTFFTNCGIRRALTTKTASYTVTTSDHIIVGNHATVAITFTLIAASSNTNREFMFKNIGAANVTIDATSLGQINNSSGTLVNTLTLTTGQSVRIVSNGTNWLVI